jgi:sulfonate transport system substrate-binding protein
LSRSRDKSCWEAFASKLCALACVLPFLTLAGCGGPTSADLSDHDSAHAESVSFRIGYQKSSVLLNLIRTRGVFEARFGPLVKVVWQEFPAGPQLLEALNVGSIDFGFTGEVPPIFAQAAGAPLFYVTSERAGPATEGILVKGDSPAKSIADLRGKRIALNKGSNVHFLLIRALEKAGLSFDDIEAVYLAPGDARAAFEAGNVDAWVIWDPYLSQVTATNRARLLADGSGLVENRAYYLATRTFVAEQPALLNQAIVELRSMDQWSQSHRDEVGDFVANLLGMDAEVMRGVQHRRRFGIELMDQDIVRYQQQIADTFFRVGLIPAHVNVADAIWKPNRN